MKWKKSVQPNIYEAFYEWHRHREVEGSALPWWPHRAVTKRQHKFPCQMNGPGIECYHSPGKGQMEAVNTRLLMQKPTPAAYSQKPLDASQAPLGSLGLTFFPSNVSFQAPHKLWLTSRRSIGQLPSSPCVTGLLPRDFPVDMEVQDPACSPSDFTGMIWFDLDTAQPELLLPYVN